MDYDLKNYTFPRPAIRRLRDSSVIRISELLRRKAAVKNAAPPPAMQRRRWINLVLADPDICQG